MSRRRRPFDVTWLDLDQPHATHAGDCGDPACHYSPSWDGTVRLNASGNARVAPAFASPAGVAASGEEVRGVVTDVLVSKPPMVTVAAACAKVRVPRVRRHYPESVVYVDGVPFDLRVGAQVVLRLIDADHAAFVEVSP